VGAVAPRKLRAGVHDDPPCPPPPTPPIPTPLTLAGYSACSCFPLPWPISSSGPPALLLCLFVWHVCGVRFDSQRPFLWSPCWRCWRCACSVTKGGQLL
jgi:hypothetical protein